MIEDKLLFREGLRLGLDQGDPMIQQRIVQKVLLLAEDLGGASRPPTDAELAAELARDPDRYRLPPRVHLMHVYAMRREDLPAGALDPVVLPAVGEAFPLPREARASGGELEQAYGRGFAEAVAALSPGPTYSAPIQSAFGWHRVRVVEREPGRLPPLADVAPTIRFELTMRRRHDVMRRYLAEVASRYEIYVDGARVRELAPTDRLARQEAASGED